MLKKPLFYYIVLIFCLAATGVDLLLNKVGPAVAQIELSEQDRSAAENSRAVFGLPGVGQRLSQSRGFYRQLTAGDRFPLLLDADDVNSLVEVRVSRISVERNITSIKGSLAKGSLATTDGSLIMTIGDKLTHVFLTANNAIFEFSGKDFQGVVARTTDMRLTNDIAISRGQSVELYSPKLQQLRAVKESIQ